jgi:glycosyltransferase involved in cell wall biosynthesis
MALKKIALVTPGFQSSMEDWCIPVFTNLARELAAHTELHVFALRYPPRRDNYLIGRVAVHSLGGGAYRGRRIRGLSLVNLWRDFFTQIRREHAVSPFSAIIGIWATEAGWLATGAASRLGVPSLVHIAGGELTYVPEIKYGNWGRGLAGRMVRSTLRRAALVTSPSTPIRAALERLGMGSKKVQDWAPGVNVEMFSPQPARERENQRVSLVTVGSLIPVKGQELLLRAMAVVRQQRSELDIALKIVGDGPLEPRLRHLTRELDLTGYVAFEGGKRHDELPGIYRGSDAFILGTWHEAQCMSVLEAMSCGLQWVGPAVGSLVDVHRRSGDEPSGLLVRDRDPASVAQALTLIADLSNTQRREWGARARSQVVEHYEFQQQALRLLGLVDRLTGNT